MFKGSGILKMSVDSLTKDSFTISWSKPSIPSIKIDDYRIYYRTVNGKWMSKDITSDLDNKTLSAKVNGLTSGELYQVKVCENKIVLWYSIDNMDKTHSS